jgi:ATP-binding cassette, subfamily B, bacterial PglK
MNSINNLFSYLKKISDILGNEKRKIPWLFVQFFLISFLELLGLGVIVPFIDMVVNPGSESFIISRIKQYIYITDSIDPIFIVGALLLIIFIVKDILIVYIYKNIFQFSYDQQARLRNQLMHTYQRMPYLTYTNKNSAEYIQSIMQHVGSFAGTLQILLRSSSEGLTMFAILIFLIYQDPVALLLLIVLLGGFSLFYGLRFRTILFENGKTQTRTGEIMFKSLHESMDGFKEIRVLGAEKIFYKTFAVSCKDNADAHVEKNIINLLPRYFLESLLITFVVLFSFYVMSGNNSSTQFISVLGAFGVASLRLIPSANTLISGGALLQAYRHPVKRLWEDLQTLSSPTKVVGSETLKIHSNTHTFKLLELQNISFLYPDTEEVILRNISLEIKKGDSIGIIGVSGAGKTTLIDMLMGLVEPTEGDIFLDNDPLSGKTLQLWRDQVAYLPQQIFLMDDSLKNNIALGIPNDSINLKKVKMAIKQAQLTSLLEKLPQGVETMLGERGVRLSGGQRQRVALARAFYHDRDVLIFDEATSSLDDETEKEIVSEIQQLKGKKTIIVIAHRMSTLQHCDRIISLEKGKIIEKNA